MILITNIALALIGFYIIIVVGFLPELLGCRLQQVLHSNMLAKHSLGFLLLIILVVVVNPENADLRFLEIIGISAAVYLWFLISTRAHYTFAAITLILLLIVYVLDSKKSRSLKNKDDKNVKLIEKIQIIIIITSVIINIIGFSIYIVEKKMEYKNQFKFWKFLIGKPECRNFNPDNAKLLTKSIVQYSQ